MPAWLRKVLSYVGLATELAADAAAVAVVVAPQFDNDPKTQADIEKAARAAAAAKSLADSVKAKTEA